MCSCLKTGNCGNLSVQTINNFRFVATKADPMWAPFTALKYKELGLHIFAREVDLPISLRLTDSVKD